VLVMLLGRVVERAPKERLFATPAHPYTRALLASTPRLDATPANPATAPIRGEFPSPLAPPSGCAFRTRCPHAIDACAQVVPPLDAVGASHEAACIRWREIG